MYGSLQNLKTPKDIYENVDLLPGEVTAEKLAQKLAKPVLKCKKKKEQEQQEDTTQTTTETTVASEKEGKHQTKTFCLCMFWRIKAETLFNRQIPFNC